MSSLLKAFTFGKAKHKKLPEEWGASIKQPVNEGMNFYVKYLGSTLVAEPSSETATAEAIKTIIAMAKASGKKLSHVSLTVKPSGIATHDVTTGEKHLDVSIYRISYCSADATYDRVVAFIATNKNETLECHAFLTSKKKIAQAAALTISQAFTIAFDKWQTSKSGKNGTPAKDPAANGKHEDGAKRAANAQVLEPSLIDLTSEENVPPVVQKPTETLDFDFDLDDSFSSFAQSRTTTTKESFMLPTNLDVNYQDLPSYFNFNEKSEKEGKFFTDDSPDDLLSL